MSAKQPVTAKPARTPDSAFTFSFAIAIGLILFIAGLVVSLTLGGGSSVALIFGLPLLFAGLLVPLFMMRQFFTRNEVTGACPHCGASIRTSDATIRLACPSCQRIVGVRNEDFYAVENAD
jgi:predicted RNA-binding Zn-ribbon protein involved in translation (DUF1610 family)